MTVSEPTTSADNRARPVTETATVADGGFTLIELLVVCAILGILATLVVPGYKEFRQKANTARAVAEIRGMEKGVNAYALEKGVFPGSLNEIPDKVPADPWGNAYVYANIADLGDPPLKDFTNTAYNVDFDLYSKGLDGASDFTISELVDSVSDDDIVRTNDGSWVGLRK